VPHLVRRQPTPNELQKIKRETGGDPSKRWDRGVAAIFMNESTTKLAVYEPNIFIWYAAKDEHQIPKIADEIQQMTAWIGRPLKIYFWYRDDPRILTDKARLPQTDEVNGGYSYPASGDIYIFRAEEWQRVLFHEAIHALGWDWIFDKPTHLKTTLETMIGPGTQLRSDLNEMWTELLAEWMWCIWSNKDWNEQVAWSERQARTMIDLWRNSAKPWREDTNIFAYYVAKYVLMEHIGSLLITMKPPHNLTEILATGWKRLITSNWPYEPTPTARMTSS
jgi:hypothetical protein